MPTITPIFSPQSRQKDRIQAKRGFVQPTDETPTLASSSPELFPRGRGSIGVDSLVRPLRNLRFVHGSNLARSHAVFTLTGPQLLPAGSQMDLGFIAPAGEYLRGGLDYRGVSWDKISVVENPIHFNEAWRYAHGLYSHQAEIEELSAGGTSARQRASTALCTKIEFILHHKAPFAATKSGLDSIFLSTIAEMTVSILQLRQNDEDTYQNQIKQHEERISCAIEQVSDDRVMALARKTIAAIDARTFDDEEWLAFSAGKACEEIFGEGACRWGVSWRGRFDVTRFDNYVQIEKRFTGDLSWVDWDCLPRAFIGAGVDSLKNNFAGEVLIGLLVLKASGHANYERLISPIRAAIDEYTHQCRRSLRQLRKSIAEKPKISLEYADAMSPLPVLFCSRGETGSAKHPSRRWREHQVEGPLLLGRDIDLLVTTEDKVSELQGWMLREGLAATVDVISKEAFDQAYGDR